MTTSTLDLLLKGSAPETPVEQAMTAQEADLPNSATIKKMKVAELDELAENVGLMATHEGWSALTSADKKALLIGFIGGTAPGTVTGDADVSVAGDPAPTVSEDTATASKTMATVKVASATKNDPLSSVAKEIEALTDQAEVEARIKALQEQDGLNDFMLGGLFAKLNEIGDFGESKNFATYVELKYDVKYRKARYLMAIYSVLLDTGIPYGEVKHVGWTKLKELVPVLTKENYADWIKKAEMMNTDTLYAEVKAYLAGGSNDAVSTNDAQPSKTVTTKSLKLHDDQLETYNAAVAKAKEQLGTDSDTVAVDAILIEYLGNAPATKKADPAQASEPILDPAAFWQALRAKFPGDDKSAMIYAFGEDANFDGLFPNVALSIDFVSGSGE